MVRACSHHILRFLSQPKPQFAGRTMSSCAPRSTKKPKTAAGSCCGPASNGLATAKGDLGPADTYGVVQDYYGKVLSTSKDLKTSACTAGGAPHPYIRQLIKTVPQEILEKFYGCGAPLPLGITGLRVLDLGSGSGRDCYICSALVGQKGSVVGIDMTDNQVELSKKFVEDYTRSLGYSAPNMSYVKGHIEFLDKAGIQDESVDIVISNCVVNLSPDKPRVLKEVYRALAPGGEFYFSDVYCDRRLSEEARKHEVLWGECISGALYDEDFKRLAREVGFADPRVLAAAPIVVNDPELLAVTGDAKFYSITYRLFKLPGLLETTNEDYGQFAVYKGTIAGHEIAYQLDNQNKFVKGKPILVSGNTAAMLGEGGVSWLHSHFEVHGNRSVHYGLMDANPSPPPAPAANGQPSGCC